MTCGLPYLTHCLQPLLIAAMLPLLLSFIAISMPTTLLILLTACLPYSRGLTAQDLPLPLTPILSTSLIPELISTLNHSYLSLLILELPTYLCISSFL